jgi:putative SOS response-associated peptidase YedK
MPMTRAYRLDAPSHVISDALSANQGPDPWGGGDLAPGEFAPIVVRSQKTGQRVMRPMVWGYPAPNGIAPDGRVNWVPNVRNLESPFWIGNLRHSELRCLVPATSFMLRAKGKSHWFGTANAPMFAMAGIWRDLTDMPVFAIIVTASSGLPRQAGAFAMPLILESEQQDKWLTADWKDAELLVTPFAGALVEAG